MSSILIQTEHKSGLLLSPARLLKDHLILKSLHVSKNKNLVSQESCSLVKKEIEQHYRNLPTEAQKLLLQFNADAMEHSSEFIRKQFQHKKAGISYRSYYESAILRRVHELLQSFKPFLGSVKWYHKIEIAKDRFKTEPCIFSQVKPQLQFEVTREDHALKLITLVNLEGQVYPIDTMNRYHFMLEHSKRYYLLSWKDYQAIQWVEKENTENIFQDVQLFASHLLSKLEADYTVNRNGLLNKQEIVAHPHHRVLLSEISGAFLVFTPQWIYDGFLVDGVWKEDFETTRNGESYIIKRDREAEKAFVHILESLHASFSRQLNGYYHISFAEAQRKQWFLKAYHKLLEENIEVAGMDMLRHFRYSPEKVYAEAKVESQEKDTVTLSMKVFFGKEEVPVHELQKILRAGQRSVLLKDGSLGVLHDEWTQHYGLMIRHAKIVDGKLKIPRWLAFSEEADASYPDLLKPVLKDSWWQKWKQWQMGEGTVYQLPVAVHASLRPYQRKGFEWMVLLAEAGAGGCLADDMGLGKTLQTICLLAYRLVLEPAVPHLILCPSSLLYNWQQEFKKFAPEISVCVYHGAGRHAIDPGKNEYQVIISSYGTVRSDIDELENYQFGSVILDESHSIKNPDAQVTRAVCRLHAETRMALSGTPVMNNTYDLYSQLHFLLPGMLGNREFFNREYANTIDRNQNSDSIKALRKLVSPFILRRTKEQVATDLPTKTEMVMWCNMKPSQRMQYDELKSRISDSIFLNIRSEGLNKSKLQVLQGIMKLRQVCNSPQLLPSEEQECNESVKTDMLIHELKHDLAEHKVLVFSQFASMLHLLAKACADNGISYYHFDGQTPPSKRAEMVASFQETGNSTNVFLISLKTGNAGLNLTAADYVFLFDPWWNNAMQQQAIDRTHRIGQQKKVFAYKMICKDSIEERILEIQQRKKLLSDELISEDDGFVKQLTEEDVAFLFS